MTARLHLLHQSHCQRGYTHQQQSAVPTLGCAEQVAVPTPESVALSLPVHKTAAAQVG